MIETETTTVARSSSIAIDRQLPNMSGLPLGGGRLLSVLKTQRFHDSGALSAGPGLFDFDVFAGPKSLI